MSPTFARRVLQSLIRYRWPLIVTAVAIAVVAWPLSQLLTFSYDLEGMFAADDPELATYHKSKEAFGGHDLMVVTYEDPRLVTAEGMKRLKSLGDSLCRMAGVLRVQHLADVQRDGMQTVLQELADRPELADRIRDDLVNTKLYGGFLIGRDGKTTSIMMSLDTAATQAKGIEKLIPKIRQVMDETKLEYHLAGAPMMLHTVFSYLREDAQTFQIFTTLLLSVVMGVLFRSIRWVILPLAVVHGTLILTKAVLAATSSQLTMVSGMLNALVTIIGIATTIHVAVRYKDERAGGAVPAMEAVRRAFRTVLPACFWTSLTTAAGFGALMVSRIVPVQDFGYMMALGAVLVFVVAVMILPAGILVGKRLRERQATSAEELLGKELGVLGEWSAGHKWTVALCWTGLLALAVVGVTRLSTLSDFTKNFLPHSPIVRSYRFIESRLCGAGPLEVLFTKGGRLTAEDYQHLREAGEALRALPYGLRVLGLADVLDYIDDRFQRNPLGKAVMSFLDLAKRTPPKRPEATATRPRDPAPYLRLLESSPQLSPVLTQFWNRDRKLMRIQLLAREGMASEDKDQLIRDVSEVARQRLGAAAERTGEFVLFNHLVSSLMRDQAATFALAAFSIWLMMVIAFRSPWLGLVALVPNALPIVVVLGTMGWIGLPVNIATAMIASVSMGLAVDSSIHYISGFRRHLKAGWNAKEAIRRTHASVGKALVFANLAIFVGFAVLCTSNFVPTIHFGILVGVAMFGGLMGNLFILPMLLSILARFGRVPLPTNGNDNGAGAGNGES